MARQARMELTFWIAGIWLGLSVAGGVLWIVWRHLTGGSHEEES